MSRLNKIIVSSEPAGKFMEGVITAASKPGTIMQIDPSVALNNGKFTWIVYTTGTDGKRPLGPYIVLLEDDMQGKLMTDAYVAGTRCFGYCPLPGDELNLLMADVAGTGDDHTKGEKLMVDDATGKMIATTGSPESNPAMLLETLTDPTADQLAWCIWTGY